MNREAGRDRRFSGVAGNVLKVALFRMLLMSMCLPISIIVLFWQQHGLSMFDVMALQAIFAGALAALEVPSGYAADRLGRKRALVAGVALDWLGVVCYCASSGYSGFLAAELLMAAGISLVSGADEALLYDSLVQLERQSAFSRIWGRVRFGEMAFAAVGCVAGGCLAARGYRLPFYVAAVLELGAVLIALSLHEPARRSKQPGEGVGLLRSLRESLIGGKELRWFILFSALFTGVLQIAFWMYQPYFQLCGWEERDFGLFYGGMNVIAAAAAAGAHRMMQLLRGSVLVVMLTAVTVVSLVCLGNIVFAGSVMFIFLHQAARGVAGVYFSTCINRPASAEVRATVISIGSLVSRLLYAAALIPMGLLVERRGVAVGMNALAVLLLVAAVWLTAGRPARLAEKSSVEPKEPDRPPGLPLEAGSPQL